jgi:cytochrome P450
MSEEQSGSYHKLSVVNAESPPGCPVDHDFSPFNADYLSDPYPSLARARAQERIFHATSLGYVVVTRMEDILQVFKHPDVYSSGNVQDPVFPVCPAATEVLSATDFNPVAVMSNRQQPDHTRIRKYTQDGFSNRRMKLLEPYIARRADELADLMLANGSPAEFVSSFGHALPGQTIFRFIGFPESDDERLMSWTANRLAFTWGQPDDHAQVAIADNMLTYWRYCSAFVARRLANPADDFTSELLAAHTVDPNELTYREVESIIYGLSFAGHEIVCNFLSNALLCFLPRRELWQLLVDDESLIPNALEEVLRFESPQTSWRRITTCETVLGGITIAANTPVFLSLGAANREPELFAEPDNFDIQRKNARNHISFGRGIHFCLGARLARIEAQIALTTLTRKFPTLALVEEQALVYEPNITFRGPARLHVKWDR